MKKCKIAFSGASSVSISRNNFSTIYADKKEVSQKDGRFKTSLHCKHPHLDIYRTTLNIQLLNQTFSGLFSKKVTASNSQEIVYFCVVP